MKLTPIRVRGKRGQPKPAKKTSPKRKEMPTTDSQPGTKRAKSHHGNDTDGSGGKRIRNTLPWLSQLPQELLERVFLASKNLALPLVNREMHHRLTTDSIKYQLVGAAFATTWDGWYGIDAAEVVSYDGWKLDTNRIEGDAVFQSAILRLSWAKTPMILDSMDVWIRQHAHGRAYFTIPELSKERLKKGAEPGSLVDLAYNETGPEGFERPCRPIMTMREKFSYDLERFRKGIADIPADESKPSQFLRQREAHFRALLGAHIETHPGTMIPDDLLAGPFEDDGSVEMGEEKMRTLFWLVRGGACIQSQQTWEVTRTGFRAILQLIQGAGTGRLAPDAAQRRLALAEQLFELFDLLGVFAMHWPKYITQTARAWVTHLIPRAQLASAQLVLGSIAFWLRRISGRPRDNSISLYFGRRWRRWPDEDEHDRQSRSLMNLAGARIVSLSIRKARIELFLRAPYESEQRPVPAGGVERSGEVVVTPGLWSDFDVD